MNLVCELNRPDVLPFMCMNTQEGLIGQTLANLDPEWFMCKETVSGPGQPNRETQKKDRNHQPATLDRLRDKTQAA